MKESKIGNRKIVVVNQAVNYLTIGILNEFANKFDHVALITGSIHIQGEELNNAIQVTWISKFSENGLLKKSLNWIIAAAQIFWLLIMKYRKYEVFFIPNPPIAYLLMLFLPNRFSIMMWDVYPDTMKIFGISENSYIYRFWTWANRKIFQRAYKIYTIGDRIGGLLTRYINRSKINIVSLWSSFTDFEPILEKDNSFITKHNLGNKFVVQYSGNIGVTHNIDVLLDVAQLLEREETIHFQIIGRGNRALAIQAKLEELNLKNCTLLPFQKDDVFPFSLSAASIGVVVLDDRTSKGSVPSKTYNLMTAMKPILYIASTDSELFDYAMKFNNGACFHSSEVEGIAGFIKRIASDSNYYQTLSMNSYRASKAFQRKNAEALIENYISDINTEIFTD